MALAFPMTVRNVFDDMLQLLGFQEGNTAPLYIRERLITDINATLQFIQAAGGDYYARGTAAVATLSGQPSYALSSAIQNVLGPVRLADGTMLRELATRGEYALFAQLCQGTATAANAKPLAYFLDRNAAPNSATTGDAVATTLFLAPTPNAAYTLTIEGALEAPNFTYADLTTGIQWTTVDLAATVLEASAFFVIQDANGGVDVWYLIDGEGNAPGIDRPLMVSILSTDTMSQVAAKTAAALSRDASFINTTASGTVITIATAASIPLADPDPNGLSITFATLIYGSAPSVIPIPHRYVASIFLPIVRYNVTTHPWYYHRENLAAIQADYTRALGLLGVNDPSFLPPRDNSKRENARGHLEFTPPQTPQAPATG